MLSLSRDVVGDSMTSEVIEDEKQFYSKAKTYWKEVPPTVDGMLGGYGHISSIDINSSRKFLQRFLRVGRSGVLSRRRGRGRRHLLHAPLQGLRWSVRVYHPGLKGQRQLVDWTLPQGYRQEWPLCWGISWCQNLVSLYFIFFKSLPKDIFLQTE